MFKRSLLFASMVVFIIGALPISVQAGGLWDIIFPPQPSSPTPVGNWVGGVRLSPQGPFPPPASCGSTATGVFLADKQMSLQSVRNVVRSGADGSYIRVRLSNHTGASLKIDKATVALSYGARSIDGASLRQLSFGGNKAVTIAPYSEAQSDVVTLNVTSSSDIAVSAYVFGASQISWHNQTTQVSYVTNIGAGDKTAETSGGSYTKTTWDQWLLSGIDVFSPNADTTVVALGDSITDGGLTQWPDILDQRLRAAGSTRTVVNAGMACNQMTQAGAGMWSGEARFDRDVLSVPAGKHAVIFMGTNDIYVGSLSSIDTLKESVTRMAAKAHAKGWKVTGATLIPRPANFTPEKNALRLAFNDWVRTTDVLDSYIDFDAVVRDEQNPDTLKAEYYGDGIHPNVAGQAAMGNAIDLVIFQ
jgi:lysophospholipase L1-like esterase